MCAFGVLPAAANKFVDCTLPGDGRVGESPTVMKMKKEKEVIIINNFFNFFFHTFKSNMKHDEGNKKYKCLIRVAQNNYGDTISELNIFKYSK